MCQSIHPHPFLPLTARAPRPDHETHVHLITISTLPSNARLLTDLLCLDQRQFSHFLASRGAMPYRKRGGQSDGHRTRDNGAMFGNLSRHLGLGSDTCFIRLRVVTGKHLSFFCIPFSFPSPGLSGTRS